MLTYTSRRMRVLTAGLATLSAAACMESTGTGSTISQSALTASLSSVPVGFGDLSTSFVGTPTASAQSAGLWIGGGPPAQFNRSEMMGGGLADAFDGAIGFPSHGGQRGPFGGGLPCTSTFDATSGRVVCADQTNDGVTVSRSAQYLTTSGTVQQAFDTLTTNSVNVQSKVTGTMSFNSAADSATAGDHGRNCWGRGRGFQGRLLGDTSTILTATTTLNDASNRTTTGLASGSTSRTVNSTSTGNETTTGTSSSGSFVATRVAGDTTSGLVIPVVTGSSSYPTAGTVTRSMAASLQYAGQTAVTVTRREVVTYDGSATAKVVITENGTTKNCTRALPHGQLSCS